MSRNWIAICLAILMPGWALAEAVPVRGALNVGFSRLVLTFDQPTGWALGRAPGGYALRAARDDVSYDLSSAFELLPPRHITSLNTNPDNLLLIGLNCRCYADAFELDERTLIVDIIDGTPPLDALFEDDIVTPEAQSQETFIAQALAEATAQPEIVTQNADLPTANLPLLSASPVQPLMPAPTQITGDPPAIVVPAHPQTPREPTVPAPLSEAPLPRQENLSQAASSSNTDDVNSEKPASAPKSGKPTQSPVDPLRLPSALGGADTASSSVFGGSDALVLPNIPAHSTSQIEDERISTARSNLIEQLQRAMTQGLLQLPKQELPQVGVQSGNSAPQMPAEAPDVPEETLTDRREHVFIETAADRDALDPVVQALRTNSARDCLPQTWFDVADWFGDFPNAPSLEGLRAALVGEFDRVDKDTALKLAQRYLHLGFGAEARAVLSVFAVETDQAKALVDLSYTMDLEFGAQSPAFLRQAMCDSPAALWAIAANPEFRVTADLDTRSVLRHFSVLPAYLRNHIGPILAQRFIAAGDLGTTKAIRGIIDRSSLADQTALTFIDAQVELDQNNTRAASPMLETVVAQDGPQAAEALAELIENRFAHRLPIDGKLAQSADALAVEYRGTPIGARLVKASIRAFSVAGKPSTTFDRILDAVENGSISLAEARELRAEAHLGSAEFSSDVDFLQYAFLFPFETDILEGVELQARRAVARRLLELGLPDRALATLPEDESIWTEEDRLIAAGVAVSQDRPLQALGFARGMATDDALIVTAEALQAAGQLDAAGDFYQRVGMNAEADALAWRAGNWERLMSARNTAFARAARLGAGLPILDDATQTERATTVTGLDLSTDQPLAQGRQMLETSKMTREILEDLLAQPGQARP